MLDVVFLAMFVVVPVMLYSIYLVRYRRRYRLHKRLQLGLGLILLMAVTAPANKHDGAEVLVFGHIHAWSRGRNEGGGECCVLPAFDEGGVHLHHAGGSLRFCDREGEPVADPPPACFR